MNPSADNTPHRDQTDPVSRRRFLKKSSVAVASTAAASQFPFVITSHAAPDDPIRIGLVGCGGRGTGAAADALGAQTRTIYPQSGYHTEDLATGARLGTRNISVVALADLFPDRLNRSREQFGKLGMAIPNEMCFTGFDAYQKLLAVPEINYVILATPPHFRPRQLLAAIQAGKNVFAEKPVAVDAPGVRTVLQAASLAKQKGLGIAAGTQRRHMRSYNAAIPRIRDGMIGDIVCARAYWNGGTIWTIEREPGWSDMEWQIRNWNYFTWLSGDHIVEQHVHNLDIMNWVLGSHPEKARALGGRLARKRPLEGHIYDHFAVEYEYPNGIRVFSQCRQMAGCENRVEEGIEGTKGRSNCKNWIKTNDNQLWRFRDKEVNPYQQEHADLIASIRAGNPINEGQAVAESTLTGIMGRESAYSGQSIEWEQAIKSTKRWGPTEYKLGDLPFPPVPMPATYKFD